MGRVVVLSNPTDFADVHEFVHSGPFIDFLTAHYPNGFGGAHVPALKLQPLAVEDYDKEVGPDDVVVLGIYPGADPFSWAAIGSLLLKALIGAVISTALTFVINKLFGPKGTKPKNPSEAAAASPTYSLNTPTNVARIGQPIPVAYGRNLIVPDLATAPYTFYRDNNEYLVLMFCLGMGEFEIHDILVGDTSTSALAPGVLPDLRVWSPWDHGQTFGQIQNVMGWESGFHENVYTSPEVSGQELVAVQAGGLETEKRTYSGGGTLYNGADGNQGSFTLDPPATVGLSGPPPGLWMRVSGTAADDGTYQVASLYGDATDPTGYLYPQYGRIAGGQAWVNSDIAATIELSFDSTFSDVNAAQGPGTKIGPFNCGGNEVETDYIFCDVTFPNGLFSVNDGDGSLMVLGVDILFRSESTSEAGNPQTGEYWFHIEAASRTPLRRTIGWAVPKGKHRVWARRESPKGNATYTQSDVFWEGLRCLQGNPFYTPEHPLSYEHTTLITVMAKSAEGLAADALSRFSVDCTRKLDLMTGSMWTSRNPADAFYDAYTNVRYGGGRPETELDMPTLEALRGKWDGVEFFDAVFDQPNTLWETLGLTLQMQHAAPTLIGSVVSIVEDVDHTTPTFQLTEDTITDLTMVYLFSDGEEPDGVEGEYRDPADNAALYAQWPASASRPEQVTLWGCRDYDSALAYVKQRWQQLVYRRRLIKLETELEGHVLVVGQPVSVKHPLLGADPVLCVVEAVTPQEEFSVQVDLHIHQPEVYQ